MSIFPKRITHDEIVIIHFKIINEKKTLKNLCYTISIINPQGAIIQQYENNLIILPNDCKLQGTKEFYYYFRPNKNSIVGYYRVKTDMFLNGNLINSISSSEDYFLIDLICIENLYKTDNNIYFKLVNKSKENTPYQLIIKKENQNEITSGYLEGHEEKEITVTAQSAYLTYANNITKKISCFQHARIPVRLYNLFWRFETKNKICIFDNSKYSTLFLEYNEANVWRYCDGLNYESEIENYCNIEYAELKSILEGFVKLEILHFKEEA